MECFLMEQGNLKILSGPAALNGAATTGQRIKVAGERLAIIVMLGASTGSTAKFSLVQSDAATGGNSKPLQIANPYYVKHGVATHFDKIDPLGVLADTYDLSTSFAADGGIVVFEMLQEDLDVNNNFAYVQLNAVDSVTAKSALVLGMLREVRTGPTYGLDI